MFINLFVTTRSWLTRKDLACLTWHLQGGSLSDSASCLPEFSSVFSAYLSSVLSGQAVSLLINQWRQHINRRTSYTNFPHLSCLLYLILLHLECLISLSHYHPSAHHRCSPFSPQPQKSSILLICACLVVSTLKPHLFLESSPHTSFSSENP